MATELITRTWCDRCLVEHDKRTDATNTETLGVGSVTRSLDLCAECWELVIVPVENALKRYGNPTNGQTATPPPPSKAAGRHVCTKCVDREFASRSALRSHLMGTHGLDAVAVGKAMGGTVKCEQCEFLAVDNTGMSAHVRVTHGRRAPVKH